MIDNLTWQINDVEPDAKTTVSFQVKVTGSNGTLINKGKILEGENTYETNIVTNPVSDEPPKTGDDSNMIGLLSVMGLSMVGFWAALAFVQQNRKEEYFEQ